MQPEALDGSGALIGWDLERADGALRIPLARRSAAPTLCSYAFSADGFGMASEWLREPGNDVVVVHAVGKLEAAGGGHWPAIARLLLEPHAAHTVLCIRDTSLAAVALGLDDPTAHLELPAADAELEAFAADISAAVARSRRPRARAL